jgi:predicted site-specific integrase-resolvase
METETQTTTKHPLTLNVADAAAYVGLSNQAMYRIINEGRVPVIRISAHRTRLAVADLDRLFGAAA